MAQPRFAPCKPLLWLSCLCSSLRGLDRLRSFIVLSKLLRA